MKQRYEQRLHKILNARPAVMVFALIVLCLVPAMLKFTVSELAPDEEKGIVFILRESSTVFANQLRKEQGLMPREAVEQAAAIRLRPVLMTTVATVSGPSGVAGSGVTAMPEPSTTEQNCQLESPQKSE